MPAYFFLRPLLFALDPETAHRLVSAGVGFAAHIPGFLGLTRAVYGYRHPSLEMRLWNRDFPNPVGLAAGFDKDALLVDPLLALGFGFVEVGTVTPRGQPGNPRPRLFRLTRERALINRMGFNNLGALRLAQRLERRRGRSGLVGVNVGKNLDTKLDDAVSDYLTCLHAVYPVADYIKIPFLIKIAPDLSEPELADVVEVAMGAGIDGLIATNTTTSRDGLRSRHRKEEGGLSGGPLREEALRTIAVLYRLSQGRLPLVGVGGVASAQEAYALIRAGASLVQLYTALVFRGPRTVRRIKRGLVRLLRRDGFASVGEAVGSAAPHA
jgi:dihydroorotate dehydrogenase